MRVLRAILAVLFALLWVPLTNSCLITASFPAQVEKSCCEGEEHEEEQDDSIPCSAGTCTACSVLESGVNLSALGSVVIPAPPCNELAQLLERLRSLAEKQTALLSEPIPPPPPVRPPSWRDDVKTALPVRGPAPVA
jgi:hypothetical protein